MAHIFTSSYYFKFCIVCKLQSVKSTDFSIFITIFVQKLINKKVSQINTLLGLMMHRLFNK